MDVKKRVIGLDILRFLSMLGIIGLHVINNGGILNSLTPHSYKYYIVLLVVIIMYASVNIFAILSGYLYIKQKNVKNKNIINLIFILLFYCFLIPTIFYSFNFYNVRSLGIVELVTNIFPFIIGRYWYIICYIFVFFMIPFINNFINNIDKEKFKKLLIILFILFTIIPNVFGFIDFFRIENGYSPFWLIYLYMIGAYIKLYLDTYKDRKKLMITLILSIVCAFVLNSAIRLTTYQIFGGIKKSEWFISYISPFIVIIATTVTLLFKDIDVKNDLIKKIVVYLSLSSFSVYIIHSHKLIFDYVLKDNFIFLNQYNGLIIFIGILVSLIIIYIVCTLIDILRKYIFRIFKIEDLTLWLGNKLDKLLNL